MGSSASTAITMLLDAGEGGTGGRQVEAED